MVETVVDRVGAIIDERKLRPRCPELDDGLLRRVTGKGTDGHLDGGVIVQDKRVDNDRGLGRGDSSGVYADGLVDR